MLNLNAPRYASAHAVAAHTTRHTFAFAGVAFEMLIGEGVRWELPQAYADLCLPIRDALVVADVCCSVRVGLPRGAAAARGAHSYFEPADRSGRGASRPCLEITQLGAERYAAAALIEPGASSASELLLALACAVVQSAGGILLHAAAVDIGDAALLYVGARGADASDALELTGAGRAFAAERVALLPSHGVWMAWALPSGRASRGTQPTTKALPVAALLHVERSRAKSGLELASGSAAQVVVRAASEHGSRPQVHGAAREANESHLAAVASLVESIAIARLHTVSGETVTLPVDEWRSALETRKLERLHRA